MAKVLPIAIMGIGVVVIITMVVIGIAGYFYVKKQKDEPDAYTRVRTTAPGKPSVPATTPKGSSNPPPSKTTGPPVITNGIYMLQFVGGDTCLMSENNSLAVKTCNDKEDGYWWTFTIQPNGNETESSITPSSVASVNIDTVSLMNNDSTICMYHSESRNEFSQHDCSHTHSDKRWHLDYTTQEDNILLRNNHSQKCISSSKEMANCSVSNAKLHIRIKKK